MLKLLKLKGARSFTNTHMEKQIFKAPIKNKKEESQLAAILARYLSSQRLIKVKDFKKNRLLKLLNKGTIPKSYSVFF